MCQIQGIRAAENKTELTDAHGDEKRFSKVNKCDRISHSSHTVAAIEPLDISDHIANFGPRGKVDGIFCPLPLSQLIRFYRVALHKF
jgi:hypothetical protein